MDFDRRQIVVRGGMALGAVVVGGTAYKVLTALTHDNSLEERIPTSLPLSESLGKSAGERKYLLAQRALDYIVSDYKEQGKNLDGTALLIPANKYLKDNPNLASTYLNLASSYAKANNIDIPFQDEIKIRRAIYEAATNKWKKADEGIEGRLFKGSK